MSFNLLVPPSSDLAANKANKDGSDFTNPATWRANLDVPINAEARRFGSFDPFSGLAFFGAASTKVQGLTRQTIGTTPVSLWVRFRVPASFATTRGIAVLGPDASYILGSGGNSIGFGVSAASSDIALYMGDATNFTRYALGLAAYAGRIVDVVVTRTGATLAAYVNGTAVSLSGSNTGSGCAANASITATYITLACPVSSGGETFNSAIYRCVAFNRALSAADVANLIEVGVDPADQWSATTAIIGPSTLNGGFETAGGGGADVFGSWTESPSTGGSFVRDTTDFNSGAASAKFVAGSTTSTNLYQSVGLLLGKRYRVEFAAKGLVGTPQVAARIGGNSPGAANTVTLTGSWANYSVEEVNAGSGAAIPIIYLYAYTANTELLLDDVTVTRIGAFVDLELGVGNGWYIPDKSSNAAWAEASGTFDHVTAARRGHVTVTKAFDHSEISQTDGTTKIFDLPPNCGMRSLELRVIAGISGVNLRIGTAASNALFMASTNAATAGIFCASSPANAASQSVSAPTAVYLSKTAASSAGNVEVRITYEIRS